MVIAAVGRTAEMGGKREFSGGQERAGVRPEREFVGTDLTLRIDVKGSLQFRALDVALQIATVDVAVGQAVIADLPRQWQLYVRTR